MTRIAPLLLPFLLGVLPWCQAAATSAQATPSPSAKSKPAKPQSSASSTKAAPKSASTKGRAAAATPVSDWQQDKGDYGLGDVWLYVPKNPAPALVGGKRALLLSLHGCSQTAMGSVINRMYNWEDSAERTGMIVAAPTVPDTTRVVSGCWDWFGSVHKRDGRDITPLLKLVQALLARPELNIDPKQVYVVGMSSGGALAQILGCTHPEVFAGFATAAAPALGSNLLHVGSEPRVTAKQVQEYCVEFADTDQGKLNTQLAVFVHGMVDAFVYRDHATRNAQGMQQVYQAQQAGPTFQLPRTEGQTWLDAEQRSRVALLLIRDLNHAFPAGPGGNTREGDGYTDYTSINFPDWVTTYFFQNNLRVGPPAERR